MKLCLLFNFLFQGERATGYGVALLNVLFSQHINSNMLYKYLATRMVENNGVASEAYRITTQVNTNKKQRTN